MYQFTGRHILGELYNIALDKLTNLNILYRCIEEGVEKANASLCGIQTKVFPGSNGVTLLALLSESHVSIHTYPEVNALFFDAFTCGTECDPGIIADHLVKTLSPGRSVLKNLERGHT